MKFDFNAAYAKEWKELGFYYSFDQTTNAWKFTGSRKGLLNFSKLLNSYALDPSRAGVSEHEHYGPDSYLKVVTWYTATIEEDGIFGSLKDIKRLGEIIAREIVMSTSNEIVIDKEYSPQNDCSIVLKVMPENFDPGTCGK
jgi:hypothetical protein